MNLVPHASQWMQSSVSESDTILWSRTGKAIRSSVVRPSLLSGIAGLAGWRWVIVRVYAVWMAWMAVGAGG